MEGCMETEPPPFSVSHGDVLDLSRISMPWAVCVVGLENLEPLWR
jgi:hypothetical protein